MEGPLMSLSDWEQNVLDSVKDGLADSDPALVARLIIFTRLASGEEMPVREKIQAGSRRAVLRSRPQAGHTRRQQTVPPLLWLATTLALIVVALVCNRGGSQGTCTGSWGTLCTGATSAAHPAPGIF
jgi:hypothetical protein